MARKSKLNRALLSYRLARRQASTFLDIATMRNYRLLEIAECENFRTPIEWGILYEDTDLLTCVSGVWSR